MATLWGFESPLPHHIENKGLSPLHDDSESHLDLKGCWEKCWDFFPLDHHLR